MLESNGKDMHVSYRHRDTRARRFNRQDVLGWYEKEKRLDPHLEWSQRVGIGRTETSL